MNDRSVVGLVCVALALGALGEGCGGEASSRPTTTTTATRALLPWSRGAFTLTLPDGVALQLEADGALLRDAERVATMQLDGRLTDLEGATIATLLPDGQIAYRGNLHEARITAIDSALNGSRQVVLRQGSEDRLVLERDQLSIAAGHGWPTGTAELALDDGASAARPLVVLLAMVELLEHPRGHAFHAPPPEVEVPSDVAAAPAHATRTPSGLAYVVLSPGQGTVHPSATSRVRVHYTGWTTDGRRFDSSVTRGEPVELPLDAVIPGWTEAVPLMVEGERARFWMPPALGYGEEPRPGIPTGTLVFDIELLAILPP